MKQALRNLVRKLGFELLHRTDDPVLSELRLLHESLRLASRDRVRWSDALPQLAAHACLRNLLELHRIDLVLDVGANRGQFAHLVRRLGYTGEIVSFEPLARYRDELSSAAAADGKWRLMPVAIGSARAELQLHVYNDDTFSSLHKVNSSGQVRFGELVAEQHVESVMVRTLDELWPELGGRSERRVLLKTDTQGHDLEVLNGSVGMLGSVHAVIAEAALQPIYAGAPLYGEMAAWLEKHGFVVGGLFPISHRMADGALIEMDSMFTRPLRIVDPTSP
jgi:FkbM family methyltransferase